MKYFLRLLLLFGFLAGGITSLIFLNDTSSNDFVSNGILLTIASLFFITSSIIFHINSPRFCEEFEFYVGMTGGLLFIIPFSAGLTILIEEFCSNLGYEFDIESISPIPLVVSLAIYVVIYNKIKKVRVLMVSITTIYQSKKGC